MDEKESTVSGSPGNSQSDSPPSALTSTVVPAPQVMNMNVAAESIGMEKSNNVSATTAITTIGSCGGGGSGGQGSGSVDLSGKKKRGRPRRYDADGNLRVKLKPWPFQFQQAAVGGGGTVTQSPQPGFSFSPSSPSEHLLSFSSSSSSSSKRGRGRPPGSGNWQLLASLGELFTNTAGGDFTPHVVTVSTGEDVAGKIVSFSQKGPRGICILSANGAVSNVTIRQPGSSGGILTYEGRFEILSLSGSFTVTETGGVRSRTGGLSVSLAGPDGRVIGGGVAGLLLAASPIQIVVGSFMPNGYKTHKRKHYRQQTMAVASVVPGAPDMVTAARSISEAKPEDHATPPSSFADGDDPPACLAISGESHRVADKNEIPVSNSAACWNGTDHASNQKPSPDINVSVSSED